MIGPTGAARVMVATKPVDFRKGAEGLAALVRDVVVLVSRVAAQAIVAGGLPFEDAVALSLIVVDADHSRREALVPAWRTAYPKVGFSRFACA
jgi:hypothetical protein